MRKTRFWVAHAQFDKFENNICPLRMARTGSGWTEWGAHYRNYVLFFSGSSTRIRHYSAQVWFSCCFGCDTHMGPVPRTRKLCKFLGTWKSGHLEKGLKTLPYFLCGCFTGALSLPLSPGSHCWCYSFQCVGRTCARAHVHVVRDITAQKFYEHFILVLLTRCCQIMGGSCFLGVITFEFMCGWYNANWIDIQLLAGRSRMSLFWALTSLLHARVR